MGPKKKEVVNDNSWRTRIENGVLDEENWKVKVVFIESAGSEQDRIYLNKFEIFAAEEKRFVIKNICKTETIFMINQLGGEKKVKDDNLRIFEEGQAYLKEKKDIPPDIQALTIKHLIMKMKEEYLLIRRQKLEVKEGMRRESVTMIDKAEVRGTVSVQPPEPEGAPSAKGKGKKGQEPQIPEPTEGKKYNTQLRVRGEEWRDRVYVDDFPTDGPNLYVAVTGFIEPFLPRCLIKIGIPLTAIVQIRIDPITTKVPSTLFRGTKRGQSQTELQMEMSLNFWEGVQQLRINQHSAEYFENTAFIIFSPPYSASDPLSGSADKIYDELCFLMYDIQDLSRQHIHYLNHMDIIHVPEDVADDRFEKYYQHQIDDLPLECVTIYSVLDSLLRTVCKSNELDDINSRSSLSTALTVNQPHQTADSKVEIAENFVKEVFNTLSQTEQNKKTYRVTYGEEYEEHKDPVVIDHGDFAKYTTFQLGNINLNSIVESTLVDMPIHRLWWNKEKPQGEFEAKINFHINMLLSCFEREDVETAELERLMHILACRKLFNNRSSLKKNHLLSTTITEFKKVYLKRSILAEPLSKCPSVFQSCSIMSPPSFPSITNSEHVSETSKGSEGDESSRIKLLFDCPDISELVSAAEIANDKPVDHMIDDFEYFEDFTDVCAFQTILDAFNKFNCLDYKYCEVTDCLILMFFNSHDKDGISREEWRCHLPTPLCLQDYFDFILDEHYDWIQNEEKIYDEEMTIKSQSECKVLVDPFAAISCLENMEVDVELLMEGSLKYQEITNIEDSTIEPSEKATNSKKFTISPTSTEMDSKSSRKTKSPATSTPKNKQQTFLGAGDTSDTNIEIPTKPFSGYDLGNRRVEVFGKDSVYFSRDGTRVSTMYTLLIPINLENIILNVVPGNGNNEFWIHKSLGEFVTREILDLCDSLRITSKDQVMINIKKQSYHLPLPISTMSKIENVKPRESITKSPSGGNLNPTTPELFEAKSFHSFYITWPNGLVTESVHEINSSDLSYIKQHHLTPVPSLNEIMRCISLNGEVIVFKQSGEIEVLRPDSTYILITKYERRVVIPEADLLSETSSDKSKKEKGKDKAKDKQSKTSSRSSKIITDDKTSEIKPHEYKLYIDEFELIEASGLRQKWIVDIPLDIEKLLIRTATDFCLGEVFSRRMDGTNILLNKDGTQVVTFPNNTRIITNYIIEEDEIYPEWTDEEQEYFEVIEMDLVETETVKSRGSLSKNSCGSATSTMSKKLEEEELKEKERTDGYISVYVVYTIEHANFTTITVNQANGKVSVDSPNNTSVTIDANNNYEMTLDSVTTATFNGKYLHINYEACSKCRSSTTCKITMESLETSGTSLDEKNWLKMKDSFCKKIVVNEDGNISLLNEPCSKEALQVDEKVHPDENIEKEHQAEKENVEKVENIDDKPDVKSETSVTSHSKCRDVYRAKTLRFFALRRDLTCSELVHRILLDQYKQACRWQPWCSIDQYDTFGDHRSLVSILTPVNATESEKWLMESKLANKPKNLTFKDLKNDSGKGFYHWMRPYERFLPQPKKPGNVLPPSLPRAFILRTLEQQWCENERDQLKGAKELLTAILRYRNTMSSTCETILHVPIVDPRTDEVRRIDDATQALAHRIYVNLKARLDNEVQNRAKAGITTKPPPPPPEELSVEEEIAEGAEEESVVNLEEEHARLVQELEEIEEMSPTLKRYWRRRAEELKEEQFYQYLLREGSVPPYFRNLLGGAIWSDVNDTAGEAATRAERRQMRCACAPEEGTSRTDTPTTTNFGNFI